MSVELRKHEVTIGALARMAGCRVETVRFYERAGLMPDPLRSEGGHRLYDREHLKRIVFIRRARKLGFTLREVGGLLALVDSGTYKCDQIKSRTLQHQPEIRCKIADLRRLERTLDKIAARCAGGEGQDCPILDALFEVGDEIGVPVRFKPDID